MKTEYPGVDWLLTCAPRLVQLEALARSYTGYMYRGHKEEDMPRRGAPLAHAGHPTAGWGHFLEMRLGKTPTLLNEFLLFRRDHGVKRAFVLAPNKYKYTWAIEAEKFGVDVPTMVFESTKREEFKQFMREPEGMVFVNYEAVNSDANFELFTTYVNNRTFVGADESVFLKNRQATMTRRALLLSKEASIVRPMTGKPTPQGVHDLYSQLRFARRLNEWNFFQFRNRFAVMGGFKGKQVLGVKNEDSLKRLMQDCYFFARRADWGTNIDSDFEIAKIDMTSVQKKMYRDMEEEFITWLGEDHAVTADQVITKHIKQQQISSGFIIDEDSIVHHFMPFEKTPKFLELVDRLENYITCKVIIVAFFTATLDALERALKDYSPAVIRGSDYMKKSGRNVDEEKNRFNNDPKCRIILGQSKAIKYGHTLMGSPIDPCLETIYYENTYSLDDRSQTEQRNQGEGQTAPIHIVDFASSPVEQRVIAALQRKENVAAAIMGYYNRG